MSIERQTASLRTSAPEPELIAAKLAKLAQLEADIRMSFPFIQDVHGQRRFASFPIQQIVRYLHALWICDCKDMLLGIPTTLGRRRKADAEDATNTPNHSRFERHEGQHALEVLCEWQEGASADLIAFLVFKLGDAPFVDITRSYDQAVQQGNIVLTRRLAHGRKILLNRLNNLAQALAGIFALPQDTLIEEVRLACAAYGHNQEQCQAQLAEMQTLLYMLVRHPALARRNMLLMNELGIEVTASGADRPGRRTAAVRYPTLPLHSYAEHVVPAELTMATEGLLRAAPAVSTRTSQSS